MQTVVDSLLTNYETKGSSKVVLFLHGWADNLSTFQVLQDELSDEYQTVSVDLPGFGESQTPSKAWTLDDYVNFINHFLEKTKTQPAAIVGHSLGGTIAIRGVATKSLTPKKIVLLAAAGIRTNLGLRKTIFKLIAKTGKLLTKVFPWQIRNKLRNKLYKAAKSDMLIAGHMEDTFKKVVSQDVAADATKIKVPTLIIYGDKDTDTPPDYGQTFQRAIASSSLEIIPGAGHFVHHDEPEVVIEKIRKFIND